MNMLDHSNRAAYRASSIADLRKAGPVAHIRTAGFVDDEVFYIANIECGGTITGMTDLLEFAAEADVSIIFDN